MYFLVRIYCRTCTRLLKYSVLIFYIWAEQRLKFKTLHKPIHMLTNHRSMQQDKTYTHIPLVPYDIPSSTTCPSHINRFGV